MGKGFIKIKQSKNKPEKRPGDFTELKYCKSAPVYILSSITLLNFIPADR